MAATAAHTATINHTFERFIVFAQKPEDIVSRQECARFIANAAKKWSDPGVRKLIAGKIVPFSEFGPQCGANAASFEGHQYATNEREPASYTEGGTTLITFAVRP